MQIEERRCLRWQLSVMPAMKSQTRRAVFMPRGASHPACHSGGSRCGSACKFEKIPHDAWLAHGPLTRCDDTCVRTKSFRAALCSFISFENPTMGLPSRRTSSAERGSTFQQRRISSIIWNHASDQADGFMDDAAFIKLRIGLHHITKHIPHERQ